MWFFKKKVKFGGIGFFISLVSLAVILLINVVFILLDLENIDLYTLRGVIIASIFGYFITNLTIKGGLQVFFHEFKHSLPSGFVGNRARDIKLGRNSGEFSYAYSEETAKYNALIALAPYWLPLFSFTIIVIPYLFRLDIDFAIWQLVVAFAYGADCSSNWRDIGAYQTDFQVIRGGPKVAYIYVVLMNLVYFTFIFTYLNFNLEGLANWLVQYVSLVY